MNPYIGHGFYLGTPTATPAAGFVQSLAGTGFPAANEQLQQNLTVTPSQNFLPQPVNGAFQAPAYVQPTIPHPYAVQSFSQPPPNIEQPLHQPFPSQDIPQQGVSQSSFSQPPPWNIPATGVVHSHPSLGQQTDFAQNSQTRNLQQRGASQVLPSTYKARDHAPTTNKGFAPRNPRSLHGNGASRAETAPPPKLRRFGDKDSHGSGSVSGVETVDKASPMSEFGNMGAAARSFSAAPVKSGPEADVGESENQVRPPRAPDSNSYRRHHGLVVWDSRAPNSADAAEHVPPPYERFEDFRGVSPQTLNAFYRQGFQAPTPIQAQSWPIAMAGRDLISIAKTGSGKTLAFLLPAYKKMDARSHGPSGDINVLILAPTRELATQIQEEAEKFGHAAGYASTCAYGGAPKGGQLRAIRAGISVLVATPGRLNDFIDSGQVNLSSVFYLVLDEADRMLDMGFEPQIRAIVRKLPRQRQTLMFSATWPREVRAMANDFLRHPIHIQLGDASGGLQANADILQHLILLRSLEEKDEELVKLVHHRIKQMRDLILIFVARKNTCDFVANMLNRVGIKAAAMHSDRDQKHRERTLASFRDGHVPVLVATDVASRGLDVPGVGAVVNYDLASTTEDHVHRIGRTGRAGRAGEAFTFLTRSGEDTWKAAGIIEVMNKAGQQAPPEVQQMVDQMKERQRRNKEMRAAENEQFYKVLMVAEKPSVAKMIAEHLSGGRLRTRKGQSRALQIFEFIKYFPPAQQKCKIMVTSVVGHVYGLDFENGRVRDLADLFKAKTIKTVEESTKKLRVIEHIQELAQESEYLCLWLDCDLEGENIGFEVISFCQEWINFDNVYRAKFSALTRQELVNAYENLQRPDKYQALCVDARQELDLKIGVAFTRLMTRTFLDKAKEKFRLKDQKCISYGPCQTPTLYFCVQRHKEIQRFQKEPFYILSPNIDVEGYDVAFTWADGDKLKDRETLHRMEAALEAARSGAGGVVRSFREFRRKVNRPLGLNTVTLLKACSKGLGISPVNAMKCAEALYTSGFISYPRTETTAYSPTFDLIAALQEQAHHPNWGRVVSYLLNSGRVSHPERGHDVGDHPPITPMRAATRDDITKNNEWKIYDYVTRHFIASLHDDMEYTEREIVADIGGFAFRFRWHEIIEKGFMFAMPWKLKGLQLNEIEWQMPQWMLREGAQLRVNGFERSTEQTKPPDYLQESELIALMDKHGIGTDASIPQHIKNICDRHYVDVCGPAEEPGGKGRPIQVGNPHFGKNKKGGHRGPPGEPKPQSRHMVPKPLGLAFFSCFEELDRELCDPPIRAYMEVQVRKIATRETEKNQVVEDNLKLFMDKFLNFRANLERVERFFAPKGSWQAGAGFGPGRNDGAGQGGDFRGNRGGGPPVRGNFHGRPETGFRGDFRGGRGAAARGSRGGSEVVRGGGFVRGSPGARGAFKRSTNEESSVGSYGKRGRYDDKPQNHRGNRRFDNDRGPLVPY